MGRAKAAKNELTPELPPDDVLEAPPRPRTRDVQVNQVTRRQYVEQEPLEPGDDDDTGGEMQVLEDDAWADPFAPFSEIVGAGHGDATIRIWRLPRYDIDGKTAMRSTERIYSGSVPYSADNPFMLDLIQSKVTDGGMCTLELIGEGGRVQRRGLLRVAPTAPPPAPTTPAAVAAPVVVQPAAPAIDPLMVVKQHAESFVAVANVIKQLQPEYPPAPAAQVEPAQPKAQLFEAVLVEMVKSQKPDSLERVADLLSGGRDSGWLETTIKEVGPHVGNFLTQIGPGVNMWLMRMAGGQPQSVAAAPAVSLADAGTASPGAAGAPPMDASERAWRRVLFRLVDDLLENFALLQAGHLGLDVHSAAEAVADLAGRFAGNQQIIATIEQLLTIAPAAVIDACCLMTPPQVGERLLPLKEHPPSLDWLTELQTEVRAIQQQSGEPDAELPAPVTERNL